MMFATLEWFDGRLLRILQLQAGAYVKVEVSPLFPLVLKDDLKNRGLQDILIGAYATKIL